MPPYDVPEDSDVYICHKAAVAAVSNQQGIVGPAPTECNGDSPVSRPTIAIVNGAAFNVWTTVPPSLRSFRRRIVASEGPDDLARALFPSLRPKKVPMSGLPR